MIAIPISLVQRQLDNCPKLLAGRNFVDQIIEDRVVPDGCYPLISGGAVRDGILLETEPHDVDIFFASALVRGDQFSGQVAMQTQVQRAEASRLLLEDLRGWLEDKEIPYTSLLSRSSEIEGYVGSGFTFNEILEFVFEGTTIQLMFTELMSIGNIADRFPAMARIFMSRDCVHFTHAGYAAMCFSGDRIPVCNEREARYVLKKWPEANVVQFLNGSEMYQAFVRENSTLLVENIEDLFSRPQEESAVRDYISTTRFQNTLKTAMIGILCNKFHCFDHEMNGFWEGGLLRADWSSGLSEIRQPLNYIWPTSSTPRGIRGFETREVRPVTSQQIRSTFEEFRRNFGGGEVRTSDFASTTGPSLADLERQVGDSLGSSMSGRFETNFDNQAVTQRTISQMAQSTVGFSRREAQFDAELGLAPEPPGGWNIPTHPSAR